MDIFSIGIIILFICTVIFWVILASFVYYWHLAKISIIVVPLVFTFEFFAMGFFVISLAAIVIQFLPELVRILGI